MCHFSGTSSRPSVTNLSRESFMKKSHVIMLFCHCGREKLLGRWREYTRQPYLVICMQRGGVDRLIEYVVCYHQLLFELWHPFVMVHVCLPQCAEL